MYDPQTSGSVRCEEGGGSVSLEALIARQQHACSLERPFYVEPSIYRLDVDRVLSGEWLFVGHANELSTSGDFLTYEFADESVIVVRDEESAIRAFANVCRHRGSRICSRANGNVARFVCPYHGWTYGLNGELRSARLMPEGFDGKQHGLRVLCCEVVEGLVFVNFMSNPPSLEPLRAALGPFLAPFEMANCKVAYRENYLVDGNWKLVVENFLECYHCAPAHPEFARTHANKMPAGTYAERSKALMPRSREQGMFVGSLDAGFPSDPNAVSHHYGRYPLLNGHVTGSEDGAAVAPLLGEFSAYDGGASDFQIGAMLYGLAYSDHIVLYRFTPLGPESSAADILWLVRNDAREGVDYEIPRLKWMWDVTTIADKRIVQDNQAGVRSRHYCPGPHSTMEEYVSRFDHWYLSKLAAKSP